MENTLLPEISDWKIKDGIKYHKLEGELAYKTALIFINNHSDYYINNNKTLICKKEEKQVIKEL